MSDTRLIYILFIHISCDILIFVASCYPNQATCCIPYLDICL